jgi:8-oxo-dGTP pyrophosphatase MutT (NUDIX family)
MRVYFVDSFCGEFVLHEHQEIRWVKKNELLSYDVPAPDKPVIEKLLQNF